MTILIAFLAGVAVTLFSGSIVVINRDLAVTQARKKELQDAFDQGYSRGRIGRS